MIVFLVVSVVLVAGLAVGVALGRLGGASTHLSAPTSSMGAIGLPDGGFRSDDVARVTFDRVVRGYRMDQVDDVLDRLHARIVELEQHGGREVGETSSSGGSSASPRPAGDVRPVAGGRGGRGGGTSDDGDGGGRSRTW